MKKLFVGLLGLIFCMPGYAASVVASVNGAPITDADVTARVSLMNKQGQTSTDNRRIALQNIIDDSVKIAYAQNFGAVPDDETVDAELKKMNLGEMSATERAMAESALRAEIAWQIVVARTILPTVEITDSDIANMRNEIAREQGLPIEMTIVRLVDIPADVAAKLTKPKSCDDAMQMARNLGGAPQKFTAVQYELAADIRDRVVELAKLTWSPVVDRSVLLVCDTRRTDEYGKLDDTIEQNAKFKQAMPILFNFTDAELVEYVTQMGQPRFRAKQIRDWLNRGAPDFLSMKNLPDTLRRDLDAVAQTLPVRVVKKLESSDGQTTKFLLELGDGEQIECVLMRTSYGNSVCVSSQAGCAMGCKFCASTLLGLKRNLTVNEIYSQILVAQWELRNDHSSPRPIRPNGDANNGDVSHIVVMGTGEPLQNVENVIGFIERANSDMGIGWRKITVSTCGIVPGIRALTEWGRPINLAISLHAPTDELRSQIMPINNKYHLGTVLDAAFEFSGLHNRQLMIEYILLAVRGENGEPVLLNCTPEYAEKLSDLLRSKNCMVNLIPWNAVDERDFVSPSGNAVHRFQDILIKNGIHTRIRRERGNDIGSACGQLRLNNKK